MWAILLAAIGAGFGLFLSLASPRLVTGKGRLLAPACPACGKPLRPLDLLRGRSACRAVLGWQAPVLTLIGAGLGAVAGLRLVAPVPAAYAALALWVLLGVSATDIGHRIIPDSLLLVGALLAGALLFALPRASYVSHLEGMGLLFAITFVVALISGGGMGGGDVKLAAYMGLVLGLVPGVAAFLTGGLLGGLYGLGLLVARKGGLRDTFAFGPFLAGGAALILLIAPALSGL